MRGLSSRKGAAALGQPRARPGQSTDRASAGLCTQACLAHFVIRPGAKTSTDGAPNGGLRSGSSRGRLARWPCAVRSPSTKEDQDEGFATWDEREANSTCPPHQPLVKIGSPPWQRDPRVNGEHGPVTTGPQRVRAPWQPKSSLGCCDQKRLATAGGFFYALTASASPGNGRPHKSVRAHRERLRVVNARVYPAS